ncbi:MAG: undecaprenyl/decaprenyl-phosphate alpha-N-acetylglucosaminyl 1-phosphate transferase [Firmicutes bacterium]|nr:undecaprenyl/decaprenyl-phosphate alpha-N-acetylglucosaminyl 1-phosphate transferase [Bacillota bacterium]
MIREVLAFVIAAAVTALLTPLCIKIAPKIGAMDIPKDSRRMHNKPIPRFGGIAIFAGVLVGFAMIYPFAMQYRGILIGSVMILVLGIIDDLTDMPPKVKFLGQIAAAVVLWFFSLQIRGMANFLPFGPRYISFHTAVSVVVTVFWVVAITNAVNFIDGLDGLAAGISCIACIAVAYSANYTNRYSTCLLILSVAGAAFGFLLFNFHPAKIFMGDAGSMLFGFLLASVSLVGDMPNKSITLFSTLIPMLILGLPIFDEVFAIVRRAVSHKPIMQADKGHIHHRMMAQGYGQRRTVFALYIISAILGIAGILWTRRLKLEALILTAIVGCLIYVFIGKGIESGQVPYVGKAVRIEGDPETAEEAALEEAVAAAEAENARTAEPAEEAPAKEDTP